jgi:alginate O-acetyltransferase complex protein AlgI
MIAYDSLEFLVFAGFCCLVYFLLPKKYRWTALLAGSVFFYIRSAKILTVFILCSIAVLYGIGMWLDHKNKQYLKLKVGLEKDERKALKAKIDIRKRWILALAVAVNLGILLVIKYAGFFTGTVHSIASLFNINILSTSVNFVLPLGISYYTLTGISYAVDVYNGNIEAERNPLKLALFMMYFPHIVEGPFSRYGQLSKTLFNGNKFSQERLVRGFTRILYGFAKKLILADRAAILVNQVFADKDDFSGASLLLAVILYTFQIYAEFSGCMDIVCGVSEVFGVELAENFRRPFISKSIDEFWRRWHITLGEWLRDYIFFPILFSSWIKNMNAKTKKHFNSYYATLIPVSIALFFVWFGNGFWHGASWKYVCYGLYYYVLMMLGKFTKPLTDKLLAKCKINTQSRGYSVFSIIRTNIIVFFGMLIFRSHDLSTAFNIFTRIFSNFSLSPFKDGSLINCGGFTYKDFIVIVIGFIIMTVIGLYNEKGICIREKIQKYNPMLNWFIILLMCLILIIFGIYGEGSGTSPFIYGQF